MCIRDRANSEITLDDIHREIATLYGTKAFVAVNYRLLGTAPHDLELSLKSNPMSTPVSYTHLEIAYLVIISRIFVE